MKADIHQRIEKLKKELILYQDVEKYLEQSFQRPIKSLIDGYPEYTVTLVGQVLEAILKKIWVNNNVKGDPSRKAIQDLLNVCHKYIQNRLIHDYMIDIQRLRNRAAHHGATVSIDDAIGGLRRLVEILEWFKSTTNINNVEMGSVLLDIIRNKMLFINEFYIILGYRNKKNFEISPQTVYLLFERVVGIKYDYVEIIISNNTNDVLQIYKQNKEGFLNTDYPKVTRFIVTDFKNSFEEVEQLISKTNICSLDTFLGNYLCYETYSDTVQTRTNRSSMQNTHIEMQGELLTYESEKQDFIIQEINNVDKLLNKISQKTFGNLFIISDPGGGKTQQCHNIWRKVRRKNRDIYVFYFDLSLMRQNETLEDFITRQLQPYFNLEVNKIFDILYFLNRSGYVMTFMDGFDEIFGHVDIIQIMNVFGEISKLFSPKSRITIASRISFFMSSKYIRELINKNALISEKITYGITSVGIDPLQLPNFSILKLNAIKLDELEGSVKHQRIVRNLSLDDHEKPIFVSPLVYQLLGSIPLSKATSSFVISENSFCEAKVVHSYISSLFQSEPQALFEDFVSFFFNAFQRYQNIFSLIELYAQFSKTMFPDEIIELGEMKFSELFIYIDEIRVKFRHKIFLEYLFSLGFMKSGARLSQDTFFITDQIRQFIKEIADDREYFELSKVNKVKSNIVPSSYYIVGDFDRARIKKLHKTLVFDAGSITVEEYLEFLKLARKNKVTEFEHHMQPPEHSHEPDYKRMKIKGYYESEEYKKYPAILIDWWSAYAYASFRGKRLPTSFEWECAARGQFGNLFSWGDFFDLNIANSADYWAGRPLIDYEAWKQHFDSNDLRGGLPCPINEFPNNISPFGLKNMCGNVWEWSSSTDEHLEHAVICGGSFDNPFKAIKAASKGIFRIEGNSNVVGFRCCKEI